jgi:cytochrome c-type biogenesis protein CcmH/NrfG
MKDFHKAIEAYEQAIKFRSDCVEAYTGLGRIYESLAKQAYSKAEEIEKDSSR